MRVLLVDDHQLVRAGIKALLETMPGVVVVGEASDGNEALSLAHRFQPEVLLMDIAMRHLNGLEATARLQKELPACKVIILSMHATGDYLQQALSAGARGYILKDSATLELQLALDAVSCGGIYLSPAISSHLFERAQAENDCGDGLTKRQTEILRMIALGSSTKEVAFQLGISIKTVETHRAHLMKRLDIREVAGLVRYAIRSGLISV
jgi:DNA-binding NarL/FixJ family response regulator